MLFAYRDVQRAVRDERWKLIRYPRINHTQLFYLSSDPFEQTNLADRPEHQPTVTTMLNLLQDEQRKANDTCPLVSKEPVKPDWQPPAKRK